MALDKIKLGDINTPKEEKVVEPSDIRSFTTPQGDIGFDEHTHTYHRNNSIYIAVSDLLAKYGFKVDYTNIPTNVLKAAADRGSAVHKGAELFVQGLITADFLPADLKVLSKYVPDTTYHNIVERDVKLINHYFAQRIIDIKQIIPEQIYFDDQYKIAGTVDLQYVDGSEDVIADYKTTTQIYYDAVSWQLSIYAFLVTQGDLMKYYFKSLKVFHLHGGKLSVKDIPLQDYDAVKGLLEAHKNGDAQYNYTKSVANILPPSEEILLAQMTAELNNAESVVKNLKEERAKLIGRVLPEMQKHKVYILSTQHVKITYVDSQTRRSYDTKKVDQLIKNNKLNKEDFLKTTIVAPNARVTLPSTLMDDSNDEDNAGDASMSG